MSLNTKQQEALTSILKYLEPKYNPLKRHIKPEKDYFVLTGGPGTGKTYMLRKVIDKIPSHIRIACAAIGHSAKNVMVEGLGYRPKYYTIASLLGMKMEGEGSDEFYIDPTSKTQLKGYDILFLDEVSQIPDELHDYIVEECKKRNIYLIAVGDRRQLPPVGQLHDSKFFDEIDAELDEDMRFKGPISYLIKGIALEIDNINDDELFDPYVINSLTERKNKLDYTHDTGYRFMSSLNNVLEDAVSKFSASSYSPNQVRLLAYKNSTIKSINSNIRKIITNSDTPPIYLKGEILISNKNYLYSGGLPTIYNGQVVKVRSFTRFVDSYGIPCISLDLEHLPQHSDLMIRVLDHSNPETEILYQAKQNELRNKAINDKNQWVLYYRFLKSYADFEYGYAVNTYKAQGQTIENVYVFEKEIIEVKPLSWKQKFQALYVALTRASKHLVIYNEDYAIN